jgi:hypothetical protein
VALILGLVPHGAVYTCLSLGSATAFAAAALSGTRIRLRQD